MRKLPFLDRFKDEILSGRKVYTARTIRYGVPGQVVLSPFGPLEILSAETRDLAWIRDNLWKLEGVSGPADFETTWKKIHGWWDPARKVWLHKFRVVKVLEDWV